MSTMHKMADDITACRSRTSTDRCHTGTRHLTSDTLLFHSGGPAILWFGSIEPEADLSEEEKDELSDAHEKCTPDLVLDRTDLPVISLLQPLCLVNEIRVEESQEKPFVSLVRLHSDKLVCLASTMQCRVEA